MMRYVGALVALAGALGLAYGIGMVIGQTSVIGKDAVARGTTGTRLAFESRERELTVYLDQRGIPNVNDIDDRLSGATSCRVTADGYEHEFSGARQGSAATLGRWVSVGSFTLPGSSGRIDCVTQPSGIVPAQLPFVVTPHGTGEAFKSIGLVILGIFVAIGGVVAFVVGMKRARRSARAQNVGAEQVHESGNW